MKLDTDLKTETQILKLHEIIHSAIQSYFLDHLVNETDTLNEEQEAQLIFSTLRLFYENSLSAFSRSKHGKLPLHIFEKEKSGLLDLLGWLDSGSTDPNNSSLICIDGR